MICPTCRGRQFVSLGGAEEGETRHAPCPDCIGGIASCCDAAGSVDKTALQPNPKSDAICQPAPVYCSLECALKDA